MRSILERARRAGTRLELEPVNPVAPVHEPFATRVEQVRDADLLVPLPTVGGVVRPLARFARYELRFRARDGIMGAETQALGRTRMRTTDGGVMFGYRLALPDSIQLVQPQRKVDTLLKGDVLREAELRVVNRQGPILGLVEDLTPHGVKLRCRNAGEHLHAGQMAFLRLELPEPVGPIAEEVRIIGVAPTEGSAAVRVHVTFVHRNDLIADALRRR